MSEMTSDPTHLPFKESEMDLSKASEEMRHLLTQVDRDIKGWRPEAGDKVYGTVVDITEGESDFGEYPLLVIETPSGQLVGVHCFHTVLRNEIERKLKRQTLQIGYEIAIAYRGEIATDGVKNAANMYRVAVRRSVQK